MLATHQRYDFIFIDIWSSMAEPIKEADALTQLARPCLKKNGRTWIWLQELIDRVKDQLPVVPRKSTGVSTDPCLICGKAPRYDYGGLCMDCADILRVSEIFEAKKGSSRA